MTHRNRQRVITGHVSLLLQNPQRPFFHYLRLSGGLIEPRLKIRSAVLPSHGDGGFPVVGHDDELGRSAVIVAAKAHDVHLGDNARQNSEKPRLEQGGLRPFPLSHELTETKTPQPSFCSTSPAADFREGRPGKCLDLASHYSKSHFSQFTATNTSHKVIPFSVGEFHGVLIFTNGDALICNLHGGATSAGRTKNNLNRFHTLYLLSKRLHLIST